MNRMVVFLSVGLCLGWASESRAEVWREQSEKVLEVAGLNGIRIENPRGSVTVRPSPDGQIHLTAYKVTRGSDRAAARKLAERTQVLANREDGRLVIRVRYPQRQTVRVSFWEVFGGFEVPSSEVRITIEMPDPLSLWVISSSGDITTEELRSAQTIETTSGDVEVHSTSAQVSVTSTSGDVNATEVGRIQIRSVSGDVDLRQVSGPVRVQTTSGEVGVYGAADSVAISTVSGDVEVETAPHGLSVRSTSGDIVAQSASGAVRLDTGSGDVRMGLRAPLQRADISTTSGDIAALIEGVLGGDLELRTHNGAIDVDLTLDVGTVSRHLVTGKLGRGGAPIKLRSTSGDILVKGGGE